MDRESSRSFEGFQNLLSRIQAMIANEFPITIRMITGKKTTAEIIFVLILYPKNSKCLTKIDSLDKFQLTNHKKQVKNGTTQILYTYITCMTLLLLEGGGS